VITGFPGETEKQFMETYDFLNSIDISYLHVFTYSERANTPAIQIPENVQMQERKLRNKRLRILSAKKLRAFYEQRKGSQSTVIFEYENKGGWMFGFTENYVKIRAPYDGQLCGFPVNVTLTGIGDDGNMCCTLAREVHVESC
jgi:threonylcarbamoyladenosine tRNA methylthiotransferase MtaB